MKWFKKKVDIDPLNTAKSRNEIIERLEAMGYFVRPRRIRKPKIGDTIKFRSGAGWKQNGYHYSTATVIEWEETKHPRGEFMKSIGWIRAQKRSKDGKILIDTMVDPYMIVKVTKPRKIEE